MKIIGDKLRTARQIRNKTITQLAKEIEVSKQAVSQFETGSSEPKGETIFRIVKSLSFPLQYFTIENHETMNVSHTFFRALLSTSALEKNSYIEKSKLVVQIYDYLSEKLEFPSINLPRYNIPDFIDLDSMEQLTQQVREYWKLGNGPIWNVIDVLEQNGFIVSVLKHDSVKIDGFTQIDVHDGIQRFCVMLENEKKSMARRNFSAAHELGHIILHSGLPMSDLDNTDKAEQEIQANLFASCFLLPKDQFIRDLKSPLDYDYYLGLKRKWHVSIKAMFNRAYKLDLINYDEYVTLLKKYNYRMSRDNAPGEKLEPYDNIISVEKPQLFETAFEMLFDNDVVTLDSLWTEMAEWGLALDEELICDILPLEDNFFSKYYIPKAPLKINFKSS